jgi:hypothetical protein
MQPIAQIPVLALPLQERTKLASYPGSRVCPAEFARLSNHGHGPLPHASKEEPWASGQHTPPSAHSELWCQIFA